jgi:hypothetical protein
MLTCTPPILIGIDAGLNGNAGRETDNLLYETITTGQAECWTTSLLTEPTSRWATPLPPRAPTTTRSASCEASTSSLTTKPFTAWTVTEAGPASPSWLAAFCVISSAACRRSSSRDMSPEPTTGMLPQ